ncbi:MAG: hypothetical protein WB791_10935 [Waddliaceae bacterium]
MNDTCASNKYDIIAKAIRSYCASPFVDIPDVHKNLEDFLSLLDRENFHRLAYYLVQTLPFPQQFPLSDFLEAI